MKRRIIAALTALVMVVTMIPSSAFADTTDNVTKFKLMIGQVFDATASDEFNLSDKATLDNAKALYENTMKPEERAEVATEMGKMYAAYNAIANNDSNVKELKEAVAKLTAGSVTEESDIASSDIMKVASMFSAAQPPQTVNGVYNNAGSDVTVKLVLTEKEYTDAYTKEVLAIKKMVYDPAFRAFVYEINKQMKTVTDEDIDAIVANNYESATVVTTNLAGITAKIKTGYADYAYMAKYNGVYKKLAEKVEFYDELEDEVGTLKTALSTYTLSWFANSVRTADEIATAKKDIEKAADIVAKYGNMNPDFNTNKVAALKTEYKDAKEAYDQYLSISATTDAVRQLPTKAEIEKMTLKEATEAYQKFAAIDEEVVAVLGPDLQTRYNDARDALKKIMNNPAYRDEVIAEYAKEFKAAVDAIPANPGRADVKVINDAIDALNAYYKAGLETHAEIKKIDDTNISTLDDYVALTSGAFTADLAKALKKIVGNDNTERRLIAATEIIVKCAADDKAAADKVYNDFVDGKFVAASIDDKDSAAVAKEEIADYKEAYGKLNDFAKADFDFLYGDATDKAVAAAEKEIAKYEAVDLNKCFEVRDMITTLLKTIDTRVEEELASQRVQIAAIDAYFADAALKQYFENTAPFDGFYDDFVARKELVAKYVEDSSAVTAAIKTINDLVVIDVDKEDVTKARVDEVLKAYENALSVVNALTSEEKARVTNIGKLAKVEEGILAGVVEAFTAEVAKIGNITADLTNGQIEQINFVKAMNKQYTEDTPCLKDKFVGKYALPTGAGSAYDKAVKALEDAVEQNATKEFLAIKYLIDKAIAYVNGTTVRVDKNTAADIIAAVDAVSKLSDEAMDVFKDDYTTLKGKYDTLSAKYRDAKALLLTYATVTVEDQKYTGEALTPAVVVKNADGIVIDSSEYTVAYSANTNPGTATVIVTAKADAKVAGSVQGTFKITIDTPVKADITKVDTDYGIVRVYFDRNEEVNGDAVKFQVQYKKTTSDKWIVKYPTAGYDYLTLRNLTKNGKYDVRVRAYFVKDGEKVFGDFSDVKTVYANRNGSKSGIMYKAVIKNLTTKNGSVTMTVNPVKYQTVPQGVTWKYSYKKYGSQYTTWSTAKTTKSTSYTFKNLKKGTRYVFRAQYTYVTDVDKSTAVNSNYSVYKNIVVK